MSLENHLLGQRAESLFDVRCAERGLRCLPAERKACAYDRVVIAGKREWKVQVKVSRKLAKKGKGHGRKKPTWVYQVANAREDKGKTRFKDAGVDVMAVYVEALDRWHIFLASAYSGKRINVARSPVGPMKEAIENWDLLRQGVGGDFLKSKEVQLTLSIL